MIGASGKRAAVLGAINDAASIDGEVQSFVKSLLTHNQLQIGGQAKATAKAKGLVAKTSIGTPTHEIKTVGGKRVLQRVRFTCA